MAFDFKDAFECEDILVHSINMLAGSRMRMEAYGIQTFSDLQAYVAEHPGEVSVALQSATGVDGMCFDIATAGLALNQIAYNSGDEANDDMAAGHVDLSVGGCDDMCNRIESGDIVPLLLFLALAAAMLVPVAAHAQQDKTVVRVGWFESPYNQTDRLTGARGTPMSTSRRSPPTPVGPTNTWRAAGRSFCRC